MVNILGLDKYKVLDALEVNAGQRFDRLTPRYPVYGKVVQGKSIYIDLTYDDGLDESSYDRVFGAGAVQSVITQLRMGVYNA